MVKLLKKQISLINIVFCATIALLFIRIRATINTGDETLLVAVAYKLTQGFRPFVDMWELYQVGDLLWYPFLKLYVEITRSTDGIILFSRMCYLLLNIVLALCANHCLKGVVSQKCAMSIGLILMSYAPFCLYYFWYDSEMLYFGFLGTVFLVGGIYNKDVKTKRYMLLSGASFGCMCIAYPTMIVTIPVILLSVVVINVTRKHNDYKEMRVPVEFAVLGGVLAIGVAFALLAVQGIDNWFVLNKTIADSVFARKDYSLSLQSLAGMVVYGLGMIKNYYGVICLITLLSFLLGCVVPNRTIRVAVVVEILALPFVVLLKNSLPLTDLDNLYYLFYITLWSVPVFFYLPKKNRKTAMGIAFVSFPASFVGYFVTGYTSDNGALKSPMGIPFGIVAALIIYSMVLVDESEEKLMARSICKYILLIAVCFELVTFYLKAFWYPSYFECDTYFTSGPYKGIKAVEQDVSYIERLNDYWEKYSVGSTYGVVITDRNLMPIYLFDNQYMATYLFSWMPFTGEG